MSINFREMKENDIPKIISLFSNLSKERSEISFLDMASMDEIKKWLKNSNTYVYVAADDDVILAVIRAKRGHGNKSHACNLTLAVDYNLRGNRIAKQLTEHVLDILKEDGVEIARAYIYSNNITSINTILACGFTFAGSVYKHHYDEKTETYIDDFIFHKIL